LFCVVILERSEEPALSLSKGPLYLLFAVAAGGSARALENPSYPLCFQRQKLFFFKNLSKIECQVPKPPNPLKQNKIDLAF
jgi:hypothetical protein